MKNIIVMYGLSEHQIAKWIKSQAQDNYWCNSIRRGMESERLGWVGDGDIALLAGSRYTPDKFTMRTYNCKLFEGVKAEVSGQRSYVRKCLTRRYVALYHHLDA